MQISLKRILTFFVLGFAIFLMSGMLNFTIALMHGGNIPMENPIISAFSPVAMMLYIFGFMAVMLLVYGSKNLKENEKLGKRQIDTAFIMLLVIAFLFEILIRVPLLV